VREGWGRRARKIARFANKPTGDVGSCRRGTELGGNGEFVADGKLDIAEADFAKRKRHERK
jgi:hypothetical protein